MKDEAMRASVAPLDDDVSTQAAQLACGLELPEVVRTFAGGLFDPRGSIWCFIDNRHSFSFNFEKLPPMSEAFLRGFKKSLIWYLMNRSGSHAHNMFDRMKALLLSISVVGRPFISELTSIDILNFKGALPPRDEYKLGCVAGFIKKWHSLGYEGISSDAIALLEQLTLKGNVKGEAVSTMDEEDGPFTDLELEAILAATNNAYAEDELTLREYTTVWLFQAFGARPIQYASLRAGDLTRCTKNGAEQYVLMIPRAKNGKDDPRAEMEERPLNVQIGALVQQQANIARERFKGVLADHGQAPLFPRISPRQAPAGYEYHMESQGIAKILSEALRKLKVLSHRTGEMMHVTATRFRRTLGTRAAAEGYGELVIARLLFHSDTQNARVYTSVSPDIIKRLDRALARYLAPLAQAFVGRLIEGEHQATRGDDISSRILAPDITKTFCGLGSCGQFGFCGFLRPVACYTCPCFEPWLDGPHDMVLDFLLAERERLMTLSGYRIAAVNDRTILAVEQVRIDRDRILAERETGADST